MSAQTQPRTPAGTPTGGQFATQSRTESGVRLGVRVGVHDVMDVDTAVQLAVTNKQQMAARLLDARTDPSPTFRISCQAHAVAYAAALVALTNPEAPAEDLDNAARECCKKHDWFDDVALERLRLGGAVAIEPQEVSAERCMAVADALLTMAQRPAAPPMYPAGTLENRIYVNALSDVATAAAARFLSRSNDPGERIENALSEQVEMARGLEMCRSARNLWDDTLHALINHPYHY